MLRYVCFWTVFTATLAFAQRAELPRCDIGRNSERPAASMNAVVFWNAVADNSIAVVGVSRHKAVLWKLRSFKPLFMTR